jgi:hypothetical protein
MKIGGWVGKQWEQNKGTLAKVGSASLGLIPGVGIPLAIAAGAATSGVQNKSWRPAGSAPAGVSEADDLKRRRQEGLDKLGQDWENPYEVPLENDPTTGISYDAPKSGQRDSKYLDKATSMQRPSGTIANDAIDELRGRGEFQYGDRAPNDIQNDALGEIRNFRSGAGNLATQFATGGYSGGGAPAAVGSRDVSAMTERANVDELMAFDPQAAFERYVTGAQGAFDETLKTNNERLIQTAAGGGRLNTGFFDLDRGELGRQLSADARNAMQQKALETNQQKLSAITSGTGIRADDLNALRAQYLEAESGNADRSLRAGQTTAELGSKAADRDADFRLKSLGIMGDAEDRSLDALDIARGYQVGDQERKDKIFEGDRTFKKGTFDDYNDTLGQVGIIQRGDRDREDDIFSEDRDYYTGLDETAGNRFESDRDYDLAAWGAGNDTRFKGGAVARSDRDFKQGLKQQAKTDYLDLLSGNSDRVQGDINAQRAADAAKAASKDDLWGNILGTVGGYAADYFTKRME